MKIMDYLAYAGMTIVFIMSCIAIIRLWKITKLQPQPTPQPAPEPPLLYSDFEAGSLKMCCKVILYSFKCDMTHIEYSFKKPLDGVSGFDIQIMHCPGCGRKLR